MRNRIKRALLGGILMYVAFCLLFGLTVLLADRLFTPHFSISSTNWSYSWAVGSLCLPSFFVSSILCNFVSFAPKVSPNRWDGIIVSTLVGIIILISFIPWFRYKHNLLFTSLYVLCTITLVVSGSFLGNILKSKMVSKKIPPIRTQFKDS